MMQHLFFAPAHITSNRWLQAFPSAQMSDVVPTRVGASDVVWLLLRDDLSFTHIKNLSSIGARVIAMTAIESPQEARRALEAGASGYVHYLAIPQVLEQVAQVVAAGGMWLGADLMRQLVLATARILPAVETPQADLSQLTSREKAVAELVAAGNSNKEVARELDITERTVKAHLSAVFAKLQVRDRLQLVLVLSNNTGA
ncbi:LuxR C-terminal-related transcriptional regulator [Cellvibrio sp. OA-2007]|uniref:LuxR C-terminal-related transcriptional regulator n=1 Tax=Cellvibrio sp. OA-2007 TaxID=529823 RepID=UPI000B1584BC|nr:response regulator transcription factor [Cellvibrio sp. OA-2007]